MYLNVVQLAESFGVEEKVVEGWVREEGLPHIADRGRLLFDRQQVVAWAASRGLAAKAGFLAGGPTAHCAGRRIETLVRAGGIWREVAASGVFAVLEQVVGKLPGTTPAVRQLLTQRLRASDGLTWAPVGGGLALPHLRSPVALGREAGTIAILMLKEPLQIQEPAPDDQAITRLVFFVAPSPRAHLEMLGQISASLTRGGLRRLLHEAAPDADILSALTKVGVAGEGKMAQEVNS